MKKPLVLLFLLTVAFIKCVFSQDACTELGQNPGTAFPVCGNKKFVQDEVKICGKKSVPGPCNDELITDTNPYWYKFTCYTAGTLGFLITPENLEDDYDWQLFDITGHKPEEVYDNNKDLFVACNWSGEPGKTGASSKGNSLVVCGGIPNPVYSAMPELIQGHEYLLLVSHFTESQSGYSLSFEGGTADITDPKIPVIETAAGNCGGTTAYVKLNKQLKCSSLAADGSDFSVSGVSANVVSAGSPSCNTGFAMDSIVLTFDRALPAGEYTIHLKTGTDGNTLLDNCDMPMNAGTMNFTVPEDVSAAFSYTMRGGCDGDTAIFMHDGQNHVHTWQWLFDDISSTIQRPEVVYHSGGSKNVRLMVANDHCSDTSSAVVSIAEKINASFAGPSILCSTDEAVFTDNSTGNISGWQWNFGNDHTSIEKNPSSFKYNRNSGERTYKVSLTVSDDAGCTDSAMADLVVVGNCNIVVPNAFTPNNDGKNDKLYPTNAFNAENLIFRVYNRFGQIVFETRDWQSKWDGNVNGQPQNTGTYIWTLSYTLKATGRSYTFKGTTVLIR